VNPNADCGVGIVGAALLATVVSADSDTATAAAAAATTGAASAALNLDLIPHLRSLREPGGPHGRRGGDITRAPHGNRADLRKI